MNDATKLIIIVTIVVVIVTQSRNILEMAGSLVIAAVLLYTVSKK